MRGEKEGKSMYNFKKARKNMETGFLGYTNIQTKVSRAKAIHIASPA